MEVPGYYNLEENDSLEARRQYLGELCRFAKWGTCEQLNEIEHAILDDQIIINDDMGISFLNYMRDRAYEVRLVIELEDILGNDATDLDLVDFAGVVADNWEGEPLESAYDLSEQRDAIYELLGAYKAAQIED